MPGSTRSNAGIEGAAPIALTILFIGEKEDSRYLILGYENGLSAKEGFILNSYFAIKRLARSDSKAFGPDTSETRIEKRPMVVTPITKLSSVKFCPSVAPYDLI